MARHMNPQSLPVRWVTLVALLVVAALITVGVVVLTRNASDGQGQAGAPGAGASSTAGPPSSGASAASTTAATTAPAPTAPASTAPATTAPPTPRAAVDPKTGRVSTLDGLVPDYKLPPIEDGLVPVITKIPTNQKVVFLTIDDGAIKRPSDLALLEKNGIKASLFLAHTFIAGHAAFYKSYIDAGYLIEDHTMTHNLGFINLPYAQIKAEICGMADYEEQNFGRRPVFFRPPGGPYTIAVRQAAAECGIKAIVDWEAKSNAGHMDYQVGQSLRPGDIVLMHFRPEFPDDLAAFIKAQKAAGLKVVLLEDYLGVK